MLLFIKFYFCILVIIATLKIFECRSTNEQRINEENDIDLQKTNDNNINKEENEIYSSFGIEKLMKNAGLFEQLLELTDIDKVESKLSNDCNENGFNLLGNHFENCINLTLDAAVIEKITLEIINYRHVLANLSYSIYFNLTECKISSAIEEALCLAYSIRDNIPLLKESLDIGIDLFENLDSNVKHVFSDFKKCIFGGSKMDIMETANKECSNNFNLINLLLDYNTGNELNSK
ncbi:uncharacterized protein LOC142332337 [Lycorma delicatula]|uniref:uncharacterized protein LOC142332337 n=1 Tax=Lycorma delicatula TaxID=130591 RepID=UPI003F512EC7